MAKAMLFKTNSKDITLVDVKSWRDICPLLDARLFDVTRVSLGGRLFTIYVDDEGLLKDNPIPMAFDSGDLRPMLAGNLLIMQSDDAGDNRDLTTDEVEIIHEHTMVLYEFFENMTGRMVLMVDPRPVARLCGDCSQSCLDVNGQMFCSMFDNHPTVFATTECIIGLPPEEEGDDE